MDREPIWNSDTINKKKGDTTFKQCGWCNNRGDGSYRYDCMIDGYCNLLKNYNNDVQFDTECKIIKLGKNDIESIKQSKVHKIEEYRRMIESTQKEISILINLALDDIPVLPDNRKHNHFNINDEVMVFATFDESLIKDRWLSGKVVSGYRHHDGCVSVYVDEKYHNGENLDGHGYGAGMSVPTCILKSEYDWFVKNPERFKEWINIACNKSFNGKIINSVQIPIPC